MSQFSLTNEVNGKQVKKTFAEIIKDLGLNDDQVKFYQQYSLERSRRAYEVVAARELGSDELIEDWQYGGYFDAGYRGADYCSAGHALRYVHLAINKKTGKQIKFGIKCVSDFFKLTPLQIKFIKNGFNEANDEIQSSLDMYTKYQGDFDKYEKDHEFTKKIKLICDNDIEQLKLAFDEITNFMKITEIKTMLSLRLFLPEQFTWQINRAYRNIKRSLDAQQVINEEPINPHQDIFNYLQKKHPEAFKVATSLYNNSLLTTLTDKQNNLFDKLMNTKWKEIDAIIDMVNQKQVPLRANYLDIFDSLSEQYRKYGMTDKQFKLLGKCLKVQVSK